MRTQKPAAEVSLKTSWQALQEIKTVGELLDALPTAWLVFAGAGLLLYWSLSPVFILLRGALLVSSDEQLVRLILSSTWYVMLQQTGLLGWILAGLFYLKLRRGRKSWRPDASVSWRVRAVPVLLGLLLLWSAVSCLLSDKPALTWHGDAYRRDGLMSYLLYGGIFAVAWQLRAKRQVRWVLAALTAVSAGLAALAVLDLAWLNQTLHLTQVTSVFYNANHYGYFLALTAPGVLYLLAAHPVQPGRKLAALAAFGLIIASLNLNQSLGPFLGVAVALLFVLFATIWLRQPVGPVLLVLGLFAAVSVLVNLIQPRLLAALLRLSRDTRLIVRGSAAAAAAGTNRWGLWVNGIQLALEKPLFGFGPDNLGAAYLVRGIIVNGIPADRPHNELIQLAASLGFPALVFYLLALLAVGADFIRHRAKMSAAETALLTMVAAYFISSLVGNSMFYTTPFYFCVLGLAAGRIRAAAQAEPAPG
ncbi:MAG: O-antigen ligase family protein [Clostridiaceae bacterium]|nr:O-antigen ligase family protein [Clostridiaceae bacterium]